MISLLTFCATMLVTTTDDPVPPTAKKFELLQIEQNIIALTNAERAKHGLPTLVIDEELVKSARGHATWMTLNRTLTHTSQPVAENIAMGQRNSTEAVADWMASPGHRSNILNHGYLRIGAAAYRTPSTLR